VSVPILRDKGIGEHPRDSSMTLRPRVAAVIFGWMLSSVFLLALTIAGMAYLPAWHVPDRSPDAHEQELGLEQLRDRDGRLARLGVTRWHEQGYTGQGVRIAILDSGFRGYRAFLGKELPARTRTQSFRRDKNLEGKDSMHGILCAEIAHLFAPESEILLANWEPDDSESFLDAVGWARENGAQIISCSLIMPGWSDGEGGGPVHANLAHLLGTGDHAGDLLFFACTGNTAERHWAGSLQPNGEGYHQWKQGVTSNRIRPWGTDRVAVELCSLQGIELHLRVIDVDSGETVGECDNQGGSRSCVRFEPDPYRAYAIRLHGKQTTSASDARFHVTILGGALEHATAEGSISFPADGAYVEAVGAVDSEGRRRYYSACGPNSRRPKPDFVAMVPFPSSARSRPFSGTSAAAPQAAAIAALCWSRHPRWTAGQLRRALRQSALDLGPPGHDWETGYGLIRLP
jgi:subtilase family protein